MTADRKIFYGWWVVLAIFWVAFFGPMGRYVLTAFFPFLELEMGWSREVIGTVFTLQFWIYSVASILIGRMIDTIGGRIVVFWGGAFLLMGLILLSFSRSLWHFYMTYGVILALAVSMTHLVSNTAIVRKWFISKAGITTGIVIAGTGVGYGLLVPVVGWSSSLFGWRSVSVGCGVVFGSLIMMLAIFVIRSTPESVNLQPDGRTINKSGGKGVLSTAILPEADQTTRQVLRARNFWAIFLSYSIMGIALQGLLTHIVMWGIDLRMPPAKSGLLMTALTVPSISMRVLGGWLGDRFDKQRVLVYFSFCCAVVWFGGWFFIKASNSLLVFAIIIGMVQGGPFTLYTPFLGDLFGRHQVGTLIGILSLGHGVIGGTGPMIWGWIFDKTGTYEWVCVLSAACYVIAALSLSAVRVKSA